MAYVFLEASIALRSQVLTPFKGDTLFGQFCWELLADPDLFQGGLESLLDSHREGSPAVLFSSAFYKDADSTFLPVPGLPRHLWSEKGFTDFESLSGEFAQIELKNKSLGLKDFCEPVRLCQRAFFLSEERRQFLSLRKSFADSSESSNLGNLGRVENSSFGRSAYSYRPNRDGEAELVIFVVMDTSRCSLDSIGVGLERIGLTGFGAGASSGFGRYRLLRLEHFDYAGLRDGLESAVRDEKKLEETKTELHGEQVQTGLYTLGPLVPSKQDRSVFDKVYFRTFVRRGKHGGALSLGKEVDKEPVIMADEGALFYPKKSKLSEVLKRPFIGSCVAGVSSVQAGAIVQGYAPYLPVRV